METPSEPWTLKIHQSSQVLSRCLGTSHVVYGSILLICTYQMESGKWSSLRQWRMLTKVKTATCSFPPR